MFVESPIMDPQVFATALVLRALQVMSVEEVLNVRIGGSG